MVTADTAEEVDALTIGRRIRQLRTARGMTLEQLATEIDRAPSQVSMIETGKREPKLTQLQAIARALDTTIDQILAEAPLDDVPAVLAVDLQHQHVRPPGQGRAGVVGAVPRDRVLPRLARRAGARVGDSTVRSIVS